jgi:GNAT superfamily N-acetyltransferase
MRQPGLTDDTIFGSTDMRRGVATADEVSPQTPQSVSSARRLGDRLRGSLRERVAGTDPLLGGVAVVSLVVYALHGFNGALTRDLGVYTYAGQRFVAGDPPYVGIMNRAGPLAHALPGVGIWLGRLFGVGDIHGVRVFFMLIAIACVCLVYLTVRDLTGTRAAAVVAAAAFLGFEGFTAYASNGPREKTAMVLFLLAALYAVLRRRWATSGVFTALATLTWQPVFFVAAATVLVALLLAPDHRGRGIGRVALGGTATTAVVVVYYAAHGAVHTFLEGFVLINAQYTTQPSPFQFLHYVWRSLREGFGPSLWVIVAGLVAVLVLAVTSARFAWHSRDAVAATHVGLGAGLVAGLAWSCVAFNAWPDLMVLLPLAAIGVGGGVAALTSRLDPRAALATMCALALVGTTYATAYSAGNREDGLTEERASIAAVLHTGPHPARILSLQAPEVLALTHRTNATPYQMFDNGFSTYIDDTFPGGITGFVSWMQRYDPTYIVTQTRFRPWWLLPWLQENYAQVGHTSQFRWWVSKSVDRHLRHEIREANQAAVEEARS